MPAAFTPEICVRAGLMDWDHRIPFDRLILATAQLMNVSLISADKGLRRPRRAHMAGRRHGPDDQPVPAS
ncbi:MAG: PIN domain-containing protein [Hyphomonas sp.]